MGLADVYSVITYYLRHKPDICTHLQKRQAEAATVRAQTEREFPATGVRERLVARRR